MQSVPREPLAARPARDWDAWPVSWSAVWTGALAALATALMFGLIGRALGAHQAADGTVGGDTFGWLALLFGVLGSFFSFVVGGWVAGKIAGFRRAEPSALHGAISWLVAVPLLLTLAALGAGALFGNWFGGLAGTPVWAAGATAAADPGSAEGARNTALAALTALILGLIGSVLGGWMASGEPMSASYYRHRDEDATTRRVA